MDDLISRQAAIDALTEEKEMINAALDSLTLDYNARRNQEQRRGQINEDIETIKALSPAQPEIIHCKDCKNSEHWYRDRRRCFLWAEEGVSVFDDGFCNYAIRKDESQPTEPEAEKKAERDAMTLTLNGYITEEQWDAIMDVDFDHTNEIFFNTKHGKVVKFVKVRSEKE